MRPPDIPAIHPSRTRGRGSIVSTGSDERNPFLVKTGPVIPAIKALGQEEQYKASKLIWWMDATSAVLSFICFGAAIYMGDRKSEKTGKNGFDTHVDLWRESVYVVHTDLAKSDPRNDLALAVQTSVSALESALVDFCPNGAHTLYNSTRFWNEKQYSGTAVIHPYGSFSPWAVLMWIFAVSFVFQGFRAWSNWRYVSRKPDFWKYDSRKPDFWRWLEYALTAPFQILLIATSVFIQERGHVMSLMGLQGALVMMGFLNEKRIDKFYKRSLKRINEVSDDQTIHWPITWSVAKRGKIGLTMLLSWSFFAIIWYTIIHRFQEQVSNLDDCHYVSEMPKEVRFIVWSQCLLFGLFGVVQSVQVFWTLWKDEEVLKSGDFAKARNMDKAWYGVFLMASIVCFITGFIVKNTFLIVVPVFSALWAIYGLNTEIVSANTIATLRQQRWDDVAFRYSFLSVTAKTTLEVGFILLVVAREKMTTPPGE